MVLAGVIHHITSLQTITVQYLLTAGSRKECLLQQMGCNLGHFRTGGIDSFYKFSKGGSSMWFFLAYYRYGSILEGNCIVIWNTNFEVGILGCYGITAKTEPASYSSISTYRTVGIHLWKCLRSGNYLFLQPSSFQLHM